MPFTGSDPNGDATAHLGYLFGAHDYKTNGEYVPQTLKSVTVTKKIGDYAFYGCAFINSVTIKDGVLNIGKWAFAKSSINSVVLPDSVNALGERAFTDCINLKSVTMGGVSQIEYATFAGCSQLESLTLGSKIAKINYDAFLDCALLKDDKTPISSQDLSYKQTAAQYLASTYCEYVWSYSA